MSHVGGHHRPSYMPGPTATYAANMLSLSLPATAVGFAFVYMNDKRDAEDAIKKLDDTEFGEAQGGVIHSPWTVKGSENLSA